MVWIQILEKVAQALVLTVLVESIPLLFLSPQGKWFRSGLICNLLTNPLLNCLRLLFFYVFPHEMSLLVFTLCLEILVIILEAWLYKMLRRVPWRTALGLSFLCNSISFVVGGFIFE